MKIDPQNDLSDEDEDANVSLFSRIIFWSFGLIIFATFAYFDESDRGVVASFSYTVVGTCVITSKILFKFSWFWLYIAGISGIHVFLVYNFNLAINIKPTSALAPLGLLDFIIMYSGVYFLKKFFTA